MAMLELWGGISERTSPFENEISLRSKGMALCKHRETLRLLVQFPRLSTALTSFEGQGIVHTYPNPSLISSVSSPFYSSHFVRGARHSSYIPKPYYSKCIFFTSINSHFAALRSKGKANPSLISSASPLYYNSHCARRARFAYFFLKKVRPPAEPMVFALMLGAFIVGEVLDLDVFELEPEVFAEYRAELVAKASLLRFFIGCEADSLFLAGKLVYSVRKRAHIIPLL